MTGVFATLQPVVPAITLTLKLALFTTLLLLVLGTPLAWWLARNRSMWRHVITAIVALPLVLPPTVIGFYLLIALGPEGPGGVLANLWGAHTLAFTFPGLVIGSIVYSLPFMVGPARLAFEAIPEEVLESAELHGAAPFETFSAIGLPLARQGLLSGAILTFAHTIGEFGVVLMIGGNIPGETRVISIAIFDAVERLDYTLANWMSVGLVIFAFLIISAVMLIDRHLFPRSR